MKEIEQILKAYQKIDFSTQKAALATVVRVEGSSYRRIGARMLVFESGEWIGGISGGCLEGDALKKARLAMAQNKASLITYDTTEDDPFQIGVGLGCNGIIDVLITPLNHENPSNAVLNLAHCIENRQANLLLTATHVPRENETIALGDSWVLNDTTSFLQHFPIKEIGSILASEAPRILSIGKSEIFELKIGNNQIFRFLFEIINPAIRVLIFGSNYDIYSLVRASKELGWKVCCICNPTKMHPSLFEMADEVLTKDLLPSIDNFTVAISMCHDFESDYKNLLKLLDTDIAYIGLLGPKKRTLKMYDRMEKEGIQWQISNEERIFSPVGLDIGASTPEEIALSICAEIKAFFTGRTGNHLKFRSKPIYEN